jgi:hypothetical protein
VAALNYEINLLCDDKIKTGRFSSLPVKITGLLLLSLIIIASIYATALLYKGYLTNVIAAYETDVSRLTAATMPLEALEERNLLISLKTDLEAELLPKGQPVSETLRLVNSELSENLNISSVIVENSGIVNVIGSGTKMHYVAAYSQALENLKFVESADITEIKLTESSLYYFKLELQPGEESVYERGQ